MENIPLLLPRVGQQQNEKHKASEFKDSNVEGSILSVSDSHFFAVRTPCGTSVNSTKIKTLEITLNITVIICLLHLIYFLNSFKTICRFLVILGGDQHNLQNKAS